MPFAVQNEPALPATSHRVPDLIGGDYEVLSVLGRGGGAVVYRAFSRSRNEDVAVKFPDPSLEASGRHYAAINQEAQRLQSLHHANIVSVLAVGQEQGVPYFVMPLAHMGSLKTLLERSNGALPLGWTVRLIALVAGALQMLHDHGQVHLDVKPGNVLLTEGDWPLLADFATAARMDAIWNPVGRWRLPGTPTYMSPEHEGGRRVDASSDQYSLALVTWELLTGLHPPHPFEGSTVPLPAQIAAVLNRALSPHPEQRFPSMQAYAAALAEAAAAVLATRARTDRLTKALAVGSLPLAGAAGALAATAGPRPLLFDWPWFMAAFLALLLLRVLQHRNLVAAVARLADCLLAASQPGTEAVAAERRRLQRSLDAVSDMVFGLAAGILLLPVLQAFFGITVLPYRAALLASGALVLPWLVLSARLTWLGGARALAGALLLSVPAFEMFLGPAALAQGDQTPLLVMHVALGMQLAAVLLLTRAAFQQPVQQVLSRWLELALLQDQRTVSWADVLELRRQFRTAVGETLDLTLISVMIGLFLAPALRWLAPGAPWSWSLLVTFAMLTLVWARWGMRLHAITSEWRASISAMPPVPQATH